MATILAQFNYLKFHTSKLARTWDKHEETRCSELIFLEKGHLPTFEFAIDTSAASPNQWRFKLYNSADVEITAAGTIDLVVSSDAGYYRARYYGSTVAAMADGYYYLKVTNGTVSFYSDVFAWVTDVSDLLKIQVVSSAIYVGESYGNNMDYDIIFYLSANMLGMKPKISESGEDQNGVINISSGTAIFPYEFEIDANIVIYRYLYALRLLKGNGTITITYKYETFNATDILVEEIANNNNETYQLKLTFVDEADSVAMFNGII